MIWGDKESSVRLLQAPGMTRGETVQVGEAREREGDWDQ